MYGIQGAQGIAIRHRMHCLGQGRAGWRLVDVAVVGVGIGVAAATNSANEVLHDFHINVQASRRAD